MIFYKISLLQSTHEQTWVISRVQWFVLRSNCIDGNAFSFHFLNILYKVLRIYIIVLCLQASTNCTSIGFHPYRWRPGRTHDLDVRCNRKYFFHHRNNVFPIHPQIKLFHLRICLSGRQVVVRENFFIQVRRTYAKTDITNAYIIWGP